MKINALLRGRAVPVINEVMERPGSCESGCHLCTSRICFLISLTMKTSDVAIDLVRKGYPGPGLPPGSSEHRHWALSQAEVGDTRLAGTAGQRLLASCPGKQFW